MRGTAPPPSAGDARLTLAILTFNGRALLEAMLPSVRAQTLTSLQVVIVDNCSTDGTVEMLRERWPEARVVVEPRNLGVTAGLNACLDASSTELVALANNDVELESDCLQILVDALDAHPEAASACPKLLRFSDRGVLDGTGDVFDWAGTAWRRGHGERDVGQYDTEQDVFGACAALAVYRRSGVERVGRFDERFRSHYEDVDWSFRARLQGFSCIYTPQARAYHVGSASVREDLDPSLHYRVMRNALLTVIKNYPLGALRRHGRSVASVQRTHLRRARQRGELGLWLRANLPIAVSLPGILWTRARIQRSRTTSFEELSRVIGSAAGTAPEQSTTTTGPRDA